MTLEVKLYKPEYFHNSTEPYQIYGVISVSNCGYDKFSISILDTNYFPIHYFEYVKIVDSEIMIIKDGEWVL